MIDINQELIFGLDIGTRTIIGVVGYKKENKFIVLKSAFKEHEDRAMIDGQVHDIEKVAYTVKCVKEELEKAIGETLTFVSIAAAGRVLNTQVVEVTKEYEEPLLHTRMHVEALELFAIEAAKKNLEKALNTSSENYYCVAYSVMNYFLEGYMIGELEGHTGKVVSVKLLATFLPKSVVESLYEVTRRVGLVVKHLTLEPIAALTAIIPQSLRSLNLALVDIGAGTSDIAITKDGTILSYGMIPIAGDEITEMIMYKYLLDFRVADKVKQELGTKDIIEFVDIIGISHQIKAEEILTLIEPSIENLSSAIADKIIELNLGEPPKVIFCVGGGSQSIGLIEKISAKSGVSMDHITIRTGEQVDSVIDENKEINGPEVVTPYGICLIGTDKKNTKSISIILNNEQLDLLDTKQLVVMDALVAKDFKYTSLFPNKGKSLTFTLDEEKVVFKGSTGKLGSILLNGVVASLDNKIKTGDKIDIILAVPGKDAQPTLANCQQDFITVFIEDTEISLPLFLKDGDILSLDYKIEPYDDITTIGKNDLKKLISMFIYSKTDKFYVNGQIVDDTYILSDGDLITTKGFFEDKKEEVTKPKQLEKIVDLSKSIEVYVNGKAVILHGMDEFIFVNIFDFIDFDLKARRGNVALRLNGGDVSFTHKLKNGDQIEIYWE
ncbi:hypothetical protein AN641_08245 [Candidatus Epulonipiscioides gigas]|nr:hypothetical protein AN641_08245 [Epulopiscium sp. SCG-C07WGA-EpuloA2]